MDYIYKTVPYAHQERVFLASRDKANFALLMEMGTGKTKVTIDTAAWLYNKGAINAVLVVAPNGVHRNWVLNEIPAHLPDYIESRIAYWNAGARKEEKKQYKRLWDTSFQGLRILTMNVEAFSTKRGTVEAEKFLTVFNSMFVVDESSKIKTPGATRTKTLLRLSTRAKYKRILNGTLITQSPLDAYTQFYFLEPQILGFTSYYAFKNYFAIWERKQNFKTGHKYQIITGFRNLDELKTRIKRHSYRVLKAECLDLPAKIYVKYYVDLTGEQTKLYKEISNQLKVLFQTEKIMDGVINAKLAITKLIRLQQIVGGYITVDNEVTGASEFVEIVRPENNPKVKMLVDIAEECSGKIIIWARFVKEIEAIRNILKKEFGEQAVVAYYGAVSADEKAGNVAAFQNNNEVRFFIGQQHSAGYGLTLTAANTVVYFSNDFSLEARLQSEDRAHRIGQQNHVTYIDLEAGNTIDTKIISALRSKKNLADIITGDNVLDWI